MSRKRARRYRKSNKKNLWVKLVTFAVIIVLAVICGYMSARFVIAPFLGYDTQVLKLQIPSDFLSGLIGDKENINEKASNDSGYTLQFGVFSDREHAENLVAKLEKEGIQAEIRKKNNKYKVTGPIFKTKDEAVKVLKDIDIEEVKGVFITSLE